MTTNKDLFAKHVHLGTFVETGTCFGRSVEQAIELGFKDIRSVEGAVDRFVWCVEKFGKLSHVKLWHGESVKCLPVMLNGLKKPVLMFLDAHPSGPGSYGEDYMVNRAHEQSAVLKAELQIIKARDVEGDVILIDDVTPDILVFARDLFPENRANFNLYSTDEGPNKVLEVLT